MLSHSSKMNTVLVNSLLLAVGVDLVSADFTCPDGVVTCAEGKACCFQSGSGYSCCDKTVDDADLTPGIPSSNWQPFPNQSLPSDSYKYNKLDFCPYTSGKRTCCQSLLTDCVDYSECCKSDKKCCPRGSSCCGDGDWCCKEGEKCGDYFSICTSGAVSQGVQGLAVMVAVALAVLQFSRI